MEKKLIEEWVKLNNGYGYGYGSGSGLGSVYGYGSGSGSNIGDGSGSGTGYSDSSGSGSGYNNGTGSGTGLGSGNNNDFALYCVGLFKTKKINNDFIFFIDNVPTIIKHIKGNIAKGFILNPDLTLEKTFIVKNEYCFAHGKNLKEALNSLQEKTYSNMNIEDKINLFKKEFNNQDSYDGTEFFKWHNILTGSCLQGRNNFVKNNNLDLNKKYTVKEFLQKVKNQYGWNNIKELEKYYK